MRTRHLMSVLALIAMQRKNDLGLSQVGRTDNNQRRKQKMKKVMIGLATLAMVAGCTPSAEQINATATAIGYAAGLVANQTKIKDDARNALVSVLNDVRGCIPADGQSFTDAWTPVIKAKVAEFIAAGKINEATGAIVTSVAIMAAQAVDYFFDVRFQEAKKYEELVRAGASGVLDGFLAVFKPVNGSDCEDCDDCTLRSKSRKDYDKEAYEWFKANLKK